MHLDKGDFFTLKKNYYGIVILMILSIGFSFYFSEEASAEEQVIPSWIKLIAVWWGEDKISDQDFVNTLQYLIEKKILDVPPTDSAEPECGPGLVLDEITYECVIHDESDTDGIFLDAVEEQQKTVVTLIKTTAFWWGQGKIADQDFINALQYLVENNVLTIEPEKQSLIQPQLKLVPKDLIVWPKIDRIEDFTIQGHNNIDSYHLQFKLVDVHKKSLTPDGTISIVFLDDRNRILYLDAFSIRKSNYVDSFSAFEESDKSDKIFSWEIKNSDIKSGFTPYGKAKLAFTDKFGLKFFSEFNEVSTPQFN
jgi:hypothetical protein